MLKEGLDCSSKEIGAGTLSDGEGTLSGGEGILRLPFVGPSAAHHALQT